MLLVMVCKSVQCLTLSEYDALMGVTLEGGGKVSQLLPPGVTPPKVTLTRSVHSGTLENVSWDVFTESA